LHRGAAAHLGSAIENQFLVSLDENGIGTNASTDANAHALHCIADRFISSSFGSQLRSREYETVAIGFNA